MFASWKEVCYAQESWHCPPWKKTVLLLTLLDTALSQVACIRKVIGHTVPLYLASDLSQYPLSQSEDVRRELRILDSLGTGIRDLEL